VGWSYSSQWHVTSVNVGATLSEMTGQSSIVGHTVRPSSKNVTPTNKYLEVHFKNNQTQNGYLPSDPPEANRRISNCPSRKRCHLRCPHERPM
jgi:hypothetical protein